MHIERACSTSFKHTKARGAFMLYATLPPADTDVALTSRVGDFWKMYGAELEEDFPGAKAMCDAICRQLKKEHGCVTVGCMKSLSYSTLNTIICEHNGNQTGWIKSIEGLLDHQFTRLGAGAPPSAALITVSAEEKPTRQVERFIPKQKLGDHLVRTGQLHKIELPFHTYGTDVFRETSMPSVDELTCGDTSRVASEGFKYMAAQWKYVAGDKYIFEHMGKETWKRYPKPHGGGGWRGWAKKYKNRFKHGRALSCSVRFCFGPPPHLLLHPLAAP